METFNEIISKELTGNFKNKTVENIKMNFDLRSIIIYFTDKTEMTIKVEYDIAQHEERLEIE